MIRKISTVALLIGALAVTGQSQAHGGGGGWQGPAVFGAIVGSAIVGSAIKREARRKTMRTCMSFKGYNRHGVSKKVWQYFNFEEGLTAVPDGERRRRLLQQAAVAARTPAIGEVLAP